ncbi:MAG: TolC family protein [Flavobacteriales bacterium]|nr:TolC family protein [Flavobacteriales bacterium]
MKLIIITMLFSLSILGLSSQTLNDLLQKAVENNLELKELHSRYEAALTKADQVSQLPQPSIGAAYPTQSPETRLGPQVFMVSASQMFPWFGTLGSKRDVAISMAKSDLERIAATKLELFYHIKNSYFNLSLLAEKQVILQEELELFNVLEQVSLAKVESGKSTIADVLRVHIKMNELRDRIKILENQKIDHSTKINQITNSALADTIQINFQNDVAILSFNLDEYEKKLSLDHPMVSRIHSQIEASKQRQLVNKGMNSPRLGLGLDYSVVDERTDADPEFNGRDILIPKASISLPIFRKEYRGKNKEEEMTQDALEFGKQDLISKMLASLLTQKSKYDNAIIKIDLANEQIETTNSVYEILLSIYSSKGEKFDELILLQDQLIKYKLDLIGSKIETHLAKAQIDRITDY